MKIPSCLYAARKNPTEPVPFKEILPLKLKPTVSGKGDKTNEVCCLYEMSLLFACLKTNEFKENLCPNEIKAFQKCYKDNVKKKIAKKELETKGILIPGERNLSYKQLNTLLKLFPNSK